ncbi:ferredoxin [Streptomyces sp. NPDC007264]|uniref:ferredoxin n=1 Tax=Streptomyces sp. NPDC007264 TaxID=3364777 RepID=UPI0036DA4A1D
MQITVDLAKCQDHGQCAIAAPVVFQMDDEGRLVHDAHPDDTQLAAVEEAADACPVQAILIKD